MATGILQEGEYGGIIQFPIKRTEGQNGIFKNMDAYIGGGYNRSMDPTTAAPEPNGTGYTIRAGIYCYKQKNKYLSLQLLYRHWDIKGIYNADGLIDNIISPSTLIFDAIESPIDALENAIVNVYSADVVYGEQYPRQHKAGRVFFEWFVGGGIRLKLIKYEVLGNYDPNTASLGGVPAVYYPLSTPQYFNGWKIVPDFKLGIMIGFVL